MIPGTCNQTVIFHYSYFRKGPCHEAVKIIERSFWVCAQLMRGGATMQYILPLAKPRMITGTNVHVHALNAYIRLDASWNEILHIWQRTLKQHLLYSVELFTVPAKVLQSTLPSNIFELHYILRQMEWRENTKWNIDISNRNHSNYFIEYMYNSYEYAYVIIEAMISAKYNCNTQWHLFLIQKCIQI